MTSLVEIKFGSHLYGTATPESDLDFKEVVIPSARDILLQRAKGSVSKARPKQTGEKNVAGDVDRETFSLQRYLGLAAEGQTVAMDMLFAPRWAMTYQPHDIWLDLLSERRRLLSRRGAAFVGYVKQQSNKYGIKGSRIHAVRHLLEWYDDAIAKFGSHAKIATAAESLPGFITAHDMEHTGIVYLAAPSRPEPVPHIECCNRKAPFTASLKDTRVTYQKLFDEYGARSLMAERNEGVYFKALSHAVRVGHEAMELLATGHIAFPLPNAEHILRIKRGEIPYREVAEEIEGLLAQVEAAQEVSPLPDAPDLEFIDEFVADVYERRVTGRL